MRRIVLLLLNLIFSTLLACADETLPMLKVGSDVYNNVTITRVTATDIYFTHNQGMGNAKLKNLEPNMQQHFNYDPAKAGAMEKKVKTAQSQAVTNPATASTPNPADPQAVMDDAMARVKAIVNQPVNPLPRTPNMSVSTYQPGWFHPGAEKPDYNNVDIRTTQDLQYGRHDYVTSDQNPGIAFKGSELEFNSNTKLFYTDRSLPKRKLSESEMVEINRLYRIIGSCEIKLFDLQHPEPPLTKARVFLSAHRPAVIGGAVGLVLLLLVVRQFTKRTSEA
ncbi:MAG: hypothetical protein JWQ71_818 [Pedosphaera sp.]|nr:hypothetical protein [Pedosphaera sp.]